MKLSLVVPCYNEAENVKPFQEAVMTAFRECGYTYEIIYIDDGSSDATLHNLKKLHNRQLCPVRIVSFSRNFGKEAAIYAGLQHAKGDYVCIIDGDLQQRPEIVRQMVSVLDEKSEYDVVAAYQDGRKENKLISFFKKGFYRIINRLASVDLKHDASDFRTMRRSVAESILALGEYHRFSKGIFAWVGFETYFIPYQVCKRNAGKSKWGFRKLMNYAIDGMIGYTTKPLKMATFFGMMTAFAALVYLVFVVLQKLIAGIAIPGYATVIVLILFLGGMQLLCIGVIGEYVGRTFEQTKDRPIYIAKEILDYEL